MVQFLRTRWILLTCVLLLVIQFGVQVRLSAVDSQTTDEGVHLAAGYTYLTRGDFRFNPEHPPLVKALAALPLLAIRPHINERAERVWEQAGDTFFYDSWQENRIFGEEMIYNSGNNPDQLIFWGRMPMVILTLLLGVALFLIAYRHWGAPAGLVTTALYTLNPTVNGHGHLITTDIGLALGFLLATYTFWQLLQQPTWRRVAWFGLAFGFALLVKHTAVILLPLFVLLLALFGRETIRSFSLSRFIGRIAVALVVTLITLWAGFGFTDQVVPASKSISEQVYSDNLKATQRLYPDTNWGDNDQYQLKLDELTDLRNRVGKYDTKYAAIRPLLTVFPGNYLKGVFLVLGHASNGHDSFLLGEVSNKGWRYYFPYLFLVKTPIAALLVIGGGLFIALRRWRSSRLVQALAVAGGVFMLSAITSKANLGLRHVMPVMPFLFLIAGYATSLSARFTRIAYVALVISLGAFIATYPFYLSYFSPVVGGSANGRFIAGDSNIDWGQDLKRITTYVTERQDDQVFIEYGWLGTYALDHYLGRDSYRLLKDYRPGDSGYAIINVSATQNRSFSFLSNCQKQTLLTPGVIICELSDKK